MTYQDIEQLQMLLDKDIREVIKKGDISPQDYQCLDVAVDIEKDLYEIAEKIPLMENANRNDWNRNSYGTYNNRNSYGGDWDVNGTSGASYPNNGNRGGNNRGGNSGEINHMEHKLTTMMNNANTEQERQIISKLMKEMEGM